jgi:hypothetical protein
MKSIIREKLRNLLFNDGQNNDFFYGKYQGGKKLSFLKKILIILLDLATFRDFVLYHNNPLIVNTFGKAKRKKDVLLSSKEVKILNTLKSDGIVILDGYFKDIADKIVQDNIDKDEKSKNGYGWKNDVVHNKEFYEILNDKSLNKIASEYYGVQSFFRYRPSVNVTLPNEDAKDSREIFLTSKKGTFADEWHIDSIYNLQYHILLDTVSSNQSRMLFAKGRKVGFFDRFCGFASEEFVTENFDIKECCGSKGTVILFDGSIHWHRLHPVKGGKRMTSSVLFSRGQQVCASNFYSIPLGEKNIAEHAKTLCQFIK